MRKDFKASNLRIVFFENLFQKKKILGDSSTKVRDFSCLPWLKTFLAAL